MKKLIASALVVGFLLASPGAAVAAVRVHCYNLGNGAFSTNRVKCNVGSGWMRPGRRGPMRPSIVQKNKYSGSSDVTIIGNTGGNRANFNTGTGVVDVVSAPIGGMVHIRINANSNMLVW